MGEIPFCGYGFDGCGQLPQRLRHGALNAARDQKGHTQGQTGQPQYPGYGLHQGLGKIIRLMDHHDITDAVRAIGHRRCNANGACQHQRRNIRIAIISIEHHVVLQTCPAAHFGQNAAMRIFDTGIDDAGGTTHSADRRIGRTTVTAPNGILGAAGQHIGGRFHDRPSRLGLTGGFACDEQGGDRNG